MYNMPAAARLRGTFSVPVLQAALDEIVARHEVLRTVFAPAEGGEAIQRVLPEVHSRSTRPTCPRCPRRRAKPELMRLAVAEAQAPFDLARGPLVRVTLLGLAGDDYLLLLNMHHIVTDGWSIGVFLRELGETYAALVAGQPVAVSRRCRSSTAITRFGNAKRCRGRRWTANWTSGGTRCRMRPPFWSCRSTARGPRSRPTTARQLSSSCPRRCKLSSTSWRTASLRRSL